MAERMEELPGIKQASVAAVSPLLGDRWTEDFIAAENAGHDGPVEAMENNPQFSPGLNTDDDIVRKTPKKASSDPSPVHRTHPIDERYKTVERMALSKTISCLPSITLFEMYGVKRRISQSRS
jgi:hypothetical protein